MNQNDLPEWYVYQGLGPDGGTAESSERPELTLPPAPPWRDFRNRQHRQQRGRTFRPRPEDIRMVNAALHLRRPLLITGLPGTGKSSLAFAVAQELGLGEVLEWSITSRSQLKDGLYEYDAIGRLQDSDFTPGGKSDPPPIEDYVLLGPLGSAFADSQPNSPRVLLIDEIDKSDIDLPNDLLNIFEEGEFTIPELARHAASGRVGASADKQEDGSQKETKVWTPWVRLDRPRSEKSPERVSVPQGKVRCVEFPFVILTSNGERELPPAFLRRCLRLDIKPPKGVHFREIVRAHFRDLAGSKPLPPQVEAYITYVEERFSEKKEYIPTDQLLNAIHLVLNEVDLEETTLAEEQTQLAQQILRTIGS
jgi:MoxR-like ATPase